MDMDASSNSETNEIAFLNIGKAVGYATRKQQKLEDEVALSSSVAELELSIKLIEAAVMDEITNEQDGNSKPLFSNDKKRDAEQIRRLTDNNNYQALKTELTAKRNKARLCRIDAEYCNDMIRILCAFGQAQNYREL